MREEQTPSAGRCFSLAIHLAIQDQRTSRMESLLVKEDGQTVGVVTSLDSKQWISFSFVFLFFGGRGGGCVKV